MTTKKAFQYMMNEERADDVCPDDCVVVPMQGYSRMKDFYLFVPVEGLFFRSANIRRYGDFMVEMFMDGDFIGACRFDRKNRIRKLYKAGELDDAREYARGYRLWRETALGGKKINKYKEAARQSHALCDEPGKAGHDARQMIRRNIIQGIHHMR